MATEADGSLIGPVPDADGDEDGASIERSSIKRNLASIFSSQVLTWVCATVLAIAIPRYLGPSDVGLVRLAFSIWSMAAIAIAFGTGPYLTLQVAKHQRTGRSLVRDIVVLRVALFGVSSVVFAVVMMIVGSDPVFAGIMALNGLGVLVSTASEVLVAALVGLERMQVPARANVISRASGTVLAIVALLADGGVLLVVAATAGANVIGLAILVYAYRRLPARPPAAPLRTVPLIVRGSVTFLIGGIVMVVYQQFDTVVMAVLLETEALGWYSAADTLYGTLVFVPSIVMASLLPVLGRLHHDDPAEMRRLVVATFPRLMWASVPIGLGTMVVANEFAPLLFGESFRETGQVLFALGPVIILMSVNIMFGNVAAATGRQSLWNGVIAIAIVLTLPLDLLLVPWTDRTFENGAIGGALAFIVTEAFQLSIGLWKVAPYVVSRSTLALLARILAAGLAMFVATWPLREQLFLVPVLVGVPVYGLCSWLFRAIAPEDRETIRKTIAKLGRGSTPEQVPHE